MRVASVAVSLQVVKHQTQREDETEHSHLSVVTRTWQVSLIEELDNWSEKRCQQEHQNSDLESFH